MSASGMPEQRPTSFAVQRKGEATDDYVGNVLTISQSINYVICSCDSLTSESSEHRIARWWSLSGCSGRRACYAINMKPRRCARACGPSPLIFFESRLPYRAVFTKEGKDHENSAGSGRFARL